MNTEENKKLYKWAHIVLIVLAVFLGAEALGALKDLRSADPSYNSISVTGDGEVIYVPDVATFSFTVSADAKVVSDAQAEVKRKTDAILTELEKLGIEEKDIKTTDYSYWPKYRYDSVVCSPNYCPPSRQIEDGYTANHSITVKVRNSDNAGQALGVAGANGATNLSGVTFTVDDTDKMMDDARKLAIEDAKAKAESLADTLGVRLVRVVSFYDNVGGWPMPYNAEMGMGSDMAKVSAVAPTLPVGENKVNVNVTVIYEIR